MNILNEIPLFYKLLAAYCFFSVIVLYGLMVSYIAVMNLKRVYDKGLLTPFMMRVNYPVIVVGIVLDILANWLIFTVLFLEWPCEYMVTHRLKRHKYTGKGFRHKFALWWEKHIDPFEDVPDGHI